MRHLIAVLVVGVLNLVWAAVAFAQGPYLGNGGDVQSDVGGDVAASGGSLPFTGFDVGALAVGGVLLLVLGFVLRRHTRQRSNVTS
jgi:hypothetical protein